MQREDVLNQALSLLENHGLLMSEATLNDNLDIDPERLRIFWPTRNDLLYDCLRYHGNQIDIWQRRILLPVTRHWRNVSAKTVFRDVCLLRPAAPFLMRITLSISYPASRNKVPLHLPQSCSESWILMIAIWWPVSWN